MALAPSTAAQWVGAFGTIAAVSVALFKEFAVRWLWRPKLTLKIEPHPPDCAKSPLLVPAPGGLKCQGEAYFLRLWVMNEGHARAEKVQVFLSKAFRRQADKTLAPL